MAIYSSVPPPPELGGNGGQVHDEAHNGQQQQQQQQNGSQNAASASLSISGNGNGGNGGVDIETWTIEALQSLNVSPLARGTGANLSIPLDEADAAMVKKASVSIYDPRRAVGYGGVTPPPRPSSRRDSMKRREALLKGAEGSRQRRRWENDRLLHVPNAVPPEPQDFVPRPTHPVHHVPYQVAAAWELRVRAEVERRDARHASRKQTLTRTLGDSQVAGRVPRELCQRAKKTPAVRTWVRSLEEPVRRYLVEQQQQQQQQQSMTGGQTELDLRTDDDDESGFESSESDETLDSEDEEIVFVGRNGSMRDAKSKSQNQNRNRNRNRGDIEIIGGQWKRARRSTKATGTTQDEGMLFDGLGDADGGAFRRWITHSISEYYGLQSHSVLVGEPERKVVYVGIKQMKTQTPAFVRTHLPRPLWELC